MKILCYIKPPILASATLPALTLFDSEYKAYKDKVEAANAERTSDKLSIVAIKACMDSTTFKGLCLV